MYFRLGRLQRVYTYVQHVWGIIGHVTAEAGSPVGTDGAPPQNYTFAAAENEGEEAELEDRLLELASCIASSSDQCNLP